LIPIAGVIGAATATVVTTTAVVGANVYIIDSELDLSIAKLGRTALRVGAITVVMAAVVWSIRPYATSIPSLIGVVGVGTLVWAVLAYLGGFFDAEDVRSVVASLT
jgi:O-antigen/teichoic acid export membrane protein